MRDLHEVLAGSLSARERAVAGQVSTEDVLAGTVSRVRRRRRVRAAARGGAVLGVGALVVGVGWGVWGRQVPVPAVSPTVSVSPSSSVTPSPSPTRTREPAPTMVAVLGLGDLPQATEATVADATAGWAIIHYDPIDTATSASVGSGPDSRLLADVLLLADPHGVLYHLVDLDPDESSASFVGPGQWVAGSRTATVWVQGYADRESRLATLDLLTGALTDLASPAFGVWIPVPGGGSLTTGADDEHLLSITRGGVTRELGTFENASLATVSPDGSAAVVPDTTGFSFVDLGSGRAVHHEWAAGYYCADPTWVDSVGVTTVCVPESAAATPGVGTEPVRDSDGWVRKLVRASDGRELVSVPIAAGEPWWESSGTTVDTGAVVRGWTVAPSAGAQTSADRSLCRDTVARVSPDGSATPLQVQSYDNDVVGAFVGAGPWVYLSGWDECPGVDDPDPGVPDLTVVDTRTGQSAVLIADVQLDQAGVIAAWDPILIVGE